MASVRVFSGYPHSGSARARMFNQHEVQILLGGVNSPIDIDDLKRYTNYGGVFDENHPAIMMFWKVVEKFDQEQKRALLRFVTSCSRPPLLWVSFFFQYSPLLSIDGSDH